MILNGLIIQPTYSHSILMFKTKINYKLIFDAGSTQKLVNRSSSPSRFCGHCADSQAVHFLDLLLQCLSNEPMLFDR